MSDNQDTIWILTEDDISPSESEGSKGGDNYRSPWSQVQEKSAQGIKISAQQLEERMSNFMKVINKIFKRADEEVERESGMRLDEISLSVEITGEGEIKLVGSGGKVGSKGAIALKFKRFDVQNQQKPSDNQQ
jgi:hypothetical protein